jgi:hypothetical protein
VWALRQQLYMVDIEEPNTGQCVSRMDDAIDEFAGRSDHLMKHKSIPANFVLTNRCPCKSSGLLQWWGKRQLSPVAP